MLRYVFHSLTMRTHHWRGHGLDELTELYLSMGIRTLAVSLVGVFLPIYMYEIGFSIPEVVLYYLFFSLIRIPVNYATAPVIGRIGPKHSIAVSSVVTIAYMILLFTWPTLPWPIAFVAGAHSIANSLFFSAYHTDFSKVKKSKDAGKELGHMVIIQRIGAVLGPLIGGLLAGYVDPRVSIGIASVLLGFSLIPLFMTNEPVKTHQHITYKGLTAKLRPRVRNVFALSMHNAAAIIGSVMWSFWIAIVIFGDNTYAGVGLVTTTGMLVSMIAARSIGHISDTGKGPALIKLGAGVELLLGSSRLVIQTPLLVAAHNALREPAQLARGIPLVKGFYDEADQFPGQRIAYVITVENILMLVRSLMLIIVLIGMAYVNQVDMLRYAAAGAGMISVFTIVQRYKAL